jgi:hypothetical protein
MELSQDLLDDSRGLITAPGDLYAVLNAHGLYNSMRFVLRLSPEVHRKISQLPTGIVSGGDIDFDSLQAFSTYLHETIHWWQHVGTTTGLMLSLSYPAQAHVNYSHLKKLLITVGPKKSVLKLSESFPGSGSPATAGGLANVIVNNHLDIQFFKTLQTNPDLIQQIVDSPYFVCVGHSYEIAYGNILLILEQPLNDGFEVVPDPRGWERNFEVLRRSRTEGFYHGSPVGIAPVGALHIFEGQARFSQLQYLYFATGGALAWDDVWRRGMLTDRYVRAFNVFLQLAELRWPDKIDDPIVGLFLLLCDIASNPGEGFPIPLSNFETFISDVDIGRRFISLCQTIATTCTDVADAVKTYSREEYEQVSNRLCEKLLLHSPLSVCHELNRWIRDSKGVQALMAEYDTFEFSGKPNLPVRLLLAHHLAYNADKYLTPEFFCWPGVWMTGSRCTPKTVELFDRHKALFVDKADNDGIFPILHVNREESRVYETFNDFYAVNVMYDMSHQWIVTPGPFRYEYRWLVQPYDHAQVKNWADGHFERLFGTHPDRFEIL